MDTFSLLHTTPSVRRLTSFQRTPLPNHRNIGISNSPAKLAKAGFMRREDAVNDEVTCETCGIVYGEWSGESPYAVHRVLGEHCPFLHTPSPEISNRNHPEVAAARRRLFPENPTIHDHDDVVDHEDDGYSDLSDSSIVDGSAFDRSDVESDNGSTNTDTNSSGSDVSEFVLESEFSAPPPVLETVGESQSPFVSVLNTQTDFLFPFQPKIGDASLLFASRRLKTFSDPGCPECVEWAEEGFVYRADTLDVQCIFCAVVLPLHTCDPRQSHAENSVLCPHVLYKDVGNISAHEEERINLKNLQRQLNKSSNQTYTVRHPQYEEENLRVGTFENWPPAAQIIVGTPTDLSACGFYYTGCADKVRCYSCGVGLYGWQQGADPWEQHALHSPTCPHLTARGQHFVEQAAHKQALTETDLPSSANSSTSDSLSVSGTLVSPPPGTLTLDTSAVTAALATSQYTPQQVRHAVLTYFLHTSRYPTKDILLGTLRAADVNFTALCQQREALYQKDTVIEQKDTALQEKDTVIEQKDTALQEKDTVIEQKDTVIEQKDTVIQEKDTALQQTHCELQQTHCELQQTHCELQQRDGIVEQQNQTIQCHRVELQAREEELERKTQQMRYQEMQIQSLKLQMQALQADRQLAGMQAPPLGAAAAAVDPAPANDGADTPMTCDIRCKVCLSEESNTIFRPCHHVTCCSTCALQLVSCPVCRAPIRDMLPVYFA